MNRKSRRLLALYCNYFYFYLSAERQSSYFNAGTSRSAFREVLRVHTVECSKVVDVGQEAGGLDNTVKAYAALCQNALQVLHDLLGLLLDGGCYDLALLRVDRNLTGGKYETVCSDCLRVRAYGCRCEISVQNFLDSDGGNSPLYIFIF